MNKYDASKLFSNLPIFFQVNCEERRDGVLDLRQAESIIKRRPDIVLLEYPTNQEPPNFEFNNYPPLEIPKELITKRTNAFSAEVLKKDPYVAADTIMWQNIAQLWGEGHELYAYPTDGPGELVREWTEVWANMYPQATQNWVWWVRIYLRELYMAEHVRYIMEKYGNLDRPVVCSFIESFHWQHVLFQLANPNPEDIWQFYFARFEKEISQSDIASRIEKLNPIFYKHWMLKSHFR